MFLVFLGGPVSEAVPDFPVGQVHPLLGQALRHPVRVDDKVSSYQRLCSLKIKENKIHQKKKTRFISKSTVLYSMNIIYHINNYFFKNFLAQKIKQDHQTGNYHVSLYNDLQLQIYTTYHKHTMVMNILLGFWVSYRTSLHWAHICECITTL